MRGYTSNLFARSGWGKPGRPATTLEQAEEYARQALANGWYEVIIYGPDGFRQARK